MLNSEKSGTTNMLNDLKCLVFNKIELVKIQNAEMKSKTIKLKQGCDDCH